MNDHAYAFRMQITDIAENVSPWISSTDAPSNQLPIKIDTVIPDAADITSLSDTDLMATSSQNFVVNFGRNG
jgi:hypothetical protein